jgi:transposase
MPKSYHFTEEQVAELTAARKKNKNKNVDRRLEALLLRASGLKRELAAEKTGFHKQHITGLTSRYHTEGIGAVTENHYKGNHRNMSYAEEEELLQSFDELAAKGQIIEASAIKKAYEKKLGREYKNAHGQIYEVLKRHDFRKIKPRSKHPKSAGPKAAEASKKLTN